MSDDGLKFETGDWAEDFARFAEYRRTGGYIDSEVAMAEFRRAVADRVAAMRLQRLVPFDS